MISDQDWREDGREFVRAFLDEDNAVLDRAVDQLGTWRCVVLLSSLLAIAMREIFGSEISLEELSRFSKKIFSESEQKPRLIVIECVMRTGAGYQKSSIDLPVDEVLEVTVIVLRRLCRELDERSANRAELTDRAVLLAVEGTIIGA